MGTFALHPQIDLINFDDRFLLEIFIKHQVISNQFASKVLSNKMLTTFITSIPGMREVLLLGFLVRYCQEVKSYDKIIFDGYSFGHFYSMFRSLDAVLDTKIGGKFFSEVSAIKKSISKEHTGLLVVTFPEEMVVDETLDFLTKFKDNVEINLSGLVINRVAGKNGSTSESPSKNSYLERLQGQFDIFEVPEYPFIDQSASDLTQQVKSWKI